MLACTIGRTLSRRTMMGHGAGGSRTVHCASRGKLQLGSRVAVAAALVAAAPGAATLGAAAIATIAFVAAVRAAATFADTPSPPALVAAVYPRRWRAAAGSPRIYTTTVLGTSASIGDGSPRRCYPTSLSSEWRVNSCRLRFILNGYTLYAPRPVPRPHRSGAASVGSRRSTVESSRLATSRLAGGAGPAPWPARTAAARCVRAPGRLGQLARGMACIQQNISTLNVACLYLTPCCVYQAVT